jgi:hypothetical protein
MLIGVAPAALPVSWRTRRATPLGMEALSGSF